MDGASPAVVEPEFLERPPGLVSKAKFRIKRPDRWGVLVFFLSGLICLPIAAVLLQIGQESESWDHLVKTVLGGYLRNTLILVVGVTLIACVKNFFNIESRRKMG